jgi:hypothetical protein
VGNNRESWLLEKLTVKHNFMSFFFVTSPVVE